MLVNKSGEKLVERAAIANCLNDYFCEVLIVKEIPHLQQMPSRTDSTLCINSSILFSLEKIFSMLIKLDSYKSAGTDGIHPLILKQCAASFSGILARIFKNSYNTGIVPLKWKSANNITPVFQKGSKCDPANYRPISLTSIPYKMMERILRDAMLKHLIDHGLIAFEQHGFVPFKSCITNLLETSDIISDSLNKGSEIILIFLEVVNSNSTNAFKNNFDKYKRR